MLGRSECKSQYKDVQEESLIEYLALLWLRCPDKYYTRVDVKLHSILDRLRHVFLVQSIIQFILDLISIVLLVWWLRAVFGFSIWLRQCLFKLENVR